MRTPALVCVAVPDRSLAAVANWARSNGSTARTAGSDRTSAVADSGSDDGPRTTWASTGRSARARRVTVRADAVANRSTLVTRADAIATPATPPTDRRGPRHTSRPAGAMRVTEPHGA